MRIRFKDLPKYEESLDLIGQGIATSVTNSNWQMAQDHVAFSGSFSEEERWLIADPQTSGGLLISLPADQAPKLAARLKERGVSVAAIIGDVVPADGRPGLEFLK
jgi:selenide,water dikinase